MWKQFLDTSPEISLIVCDMDGTLLDTQSNLPEGFWDILEKLESQNITFVPASGRAYEALTHMFPPERMAIISDGGSLVTVHDREVFSAFIDPEVTKECLDIFAGIKDRNFGAILRAEHAAYVDRDDEEFLEEVQKYYANVQVVEDLSAVDDSILKLAACDLDSSVPIFEALAPVAKNTPVVLSGKHWVDIMSSGVDKGVAMAKLQEHLDVLPEQTMAFGDFHNDLPLFEYAEYTFAVENGHQDVRDAARWVIPSNDHGGVLQVLEELVR